MLLVLLKSTVFEHKAFQKFSILDLNYSHQLPLAERWLVGQSVSDLLPLSILGLLIF